METNNNDNEENAPGSENYDVNHPQNITTPSFNSATEKRDTDDLPGVENLNLSNNGEQQLPEDDQSLFGTDSDTDLGNSQKPEEDKADDRLIEP
jgi:hypothetical protein